MIQKGIVVTLIFIFSTLIQLVSQILVTRIFGASLNLDIFLAAVAVPTLVVTMIYATVNDAFLPLYGHEKATNAKHADDFFFSHLLILTGLSLVIALIASFAADTLSNLLYNSRGVAFVSAVSLQMRYMFFSLPLAVLATLLGSYYYSQKDFIRFPIAQMIGSMANLVIIVLLYPHIGIWALVIAFVINLAIQILFVIPGKIVHMSFVNINIWPFFAAFVPLIIGAFAVRSDTLLIRSFGAQLPAGSLVYLNLITKILSISTSILTVGIQVLLLPHLVEYISHKNYDKAIQNVHKAKIIAVMISVVVSIAVLLLGPFMIQLLFVGGKFTQADASMTSSLLPYFLIPAIGWGINSVFAQPLIALKKQKELSILHVSALGVSWGSAWLANIYLGALAAIVVGLILLLFIGIIGSEILWQHYKKTLVRSA
ncbi:MAG: lipid II flippase MurJ [Weeksellaceae bacterium]